MLHRAVSLDCEHLAFRRPLAYLGVMKRKSVSSKVRWRVMRLAGARAQEITELEAASAAAAIKRAIKEHGIDAEGQKRLAAYQVLR